MCVAVYVAVFVSARVVICVEGIAVARKVCMCVAVCVALCVAVCVAVAVEGIVVARKVLIDVAFITP